jgi:acyl-coenzyme A thioesterase PaaI-like protein
VTAVNHDHMLIRAFLEQPGAPRMIDTNPVATEYGARLLAADGDAGTIRLGFELAPRHTNGYNIVQGGILAVLLDFGIAFAVMTRLPRERSPAGTVTMTTQFLRAASPGPCFVTGRVERLGVTLAFGAAELQAADGKGVIATASAVMAVRPPS